MANRDDGNAPTPPTLDFDRAASAARTGRGELHGLEQHTVTGLTVTAGLQLSIIEGLERIRSVADDLSRELNRTCPDNPGIRAMAEQVRDDAAMIVVAVNDSR